MDVRSVAPIHFQEILAIPGSNRRAGFVVSADQTVTGQVVDVDHDIVLIQIGQHRVSARATGTSLRAGETVRLQVDTLDPDEVVMRLVARGSSTTTLRSLTDDDLAADLARLGVQAGPDTLAVARALIARGVPVTSRNVLMARAAVGRLEDPTAADLDAIAFLQSRELPLSRDAIAIARGALASRTSLGGDIARLRDSLAGLNARVAALPDDGVFEEAAVTPGSRGGVPIAVDDDETQPRGSDASVPAGRARGQSRAADDAPSATTSEEGAGFGDDESAEGGAIRSRLVAGRQPPGSGPDAGPDVRVRTTELPPGRGAVESGGVEWTATGGTVAVGGDEVPANEGDPGRRPNGHWSAEGQSRLATDSQASDGVGRRSTARPSSASEARAAVSNSANRPDLSAPGASDERTDGSDLDATSTSPDAHHRPDRPVDGGTTERALAELPGQERSRMLARPGRVPSAESGRAVTNADDVDVVDADVAAARSPVAVSDGGSVRRGDDAARYTSGERDAPTGTMDGTATGDPEAVTNQLGARFDRPLSRGAADDRPSLARLVEVVAETLEQLPRVDDAAARGDADGLASELRRVLSEHATPTEAKLARVLDGLSSRDDFARLIDADLKVSLRALARDATAMAGRLSDRLAQSTLADDLRAVARQAEGLLSRVEFQQMAAAAPRSDGTPDAGYVTFHVPFGGGGQARSLTIRVRDEGDGRDAPRVDPANTHLVFQFDLENLRTVRVSLRVVGRKLTCQIGASDLAVTALLAERSAELRAGLVGLGFAVDPIRCEPLTADRATQDERLAAPHATRLDARV
ncbi:MAG: flagellar hook-length control protein FliK [Chloroflexota bacterium]|nr:MAG: flagellar hook-length control protein FliK [Chloroflexota bacterium]